MDQSILVALQVHNPWLNQPGSQKDLLLSNLPIPYIPREATLELRPGIAELVIGPRQAGKSTWIREQLAKRNEPILLLHAEEPRIRELCQSPAEALHALSGVLTDKTILFLEEVQHLENAPLFIKGLVDLQPQRRIIATGSSSFQFQAKNRESLAGRARRTLLLPFSLKEMAKTITACLLPAMYEEGLDRLWKRLLVTGGYPRPWNQSEPSFELRRLVEAFVLKDASDLHTIEHPAAFRKLIEFASADIGNLVNHSEWASVSGISRTAAMRYLEIATDAHVLRFVPPFASGKRAELKGAVKVFFVDNGLRNALFGGFDPIEQRADRGALWENAVFTELLKRTDLLDRIYFWRTKNRAEVDFVVQRGRDTIGIEVKASTLARPVLSKSARSFLSAYRVNCFGVINGSLSADLLVGQTPVKFRRPWEIEELLNQF